MDVSFCATCPLLLMLWQTDFSFCSTGPLLLLLWQTDISFCVTCPLWQLIRQTYFHSVTMPTFTAMADRCFILCHMPTMTADMTYRFSFCGNANFHCCYGRQIFLTCCCDKQTLILCHMPTFTAAMAERCLILCHIPTFTADTTDRFSFYATCPLTSLHGLCLLYFINLLCACLIGWNWCNTIFHQSYFLIMPCQSECPFHYVVIIGIGDLVIGLDMEITVISKSLI